MIGRKLEKVEPKPVTVSSPNDLIAMAVSQGADVEKIEKLIALQERWEANEAKKAFVKALAGFNSEVVEIIKNKKGHNNQYASLDNIVDVVTPLLAKYDLSKTWKTTQDSNTITVTCVLIHSLGYSESTSLTEGRDMSGNKSSIHGLGSTVSYLERYTLKALLGLAEKEQDDDGQKALDRPPNKRAPTISKEIKDIVYADTVKYLNDLDDQGVLETLSGFDQDEKMVLWGMFNSGQRKAINHAIENAKEANEKGEKNNG